MRRAKEKIFFQAYKISARTTLFTESINTRKDGYTEKSSISVILVGKNAFEANDTPMYHTVANMLRMHENELNMPRSILQRTIKKLLLPK